MKDAHTSAFNDFTKIEHGTQLMKFVARSNDDTKPLYGQPYPKIEIHGFVDHLGRFFITDEIVSYDRTKPEELNP